MQESLLNTVKKMQAEEKINVAELEVLLGSEIEEVVTLCKKACLKPKTDSMGNAYFTKQDIDVLKKMKELHAKSQEIQHKQEASPKVIIDENENLTDTTKKVNFLQKAKDRIKTQTNVVPSNSASIAYLQGSLNNLENSIISRMNEILSEKMDGFDEIIVELIRAKTENENLRQQINTLNKQVFVLKNELASFDPVFFGFYTKKETDDM